MKRKLPWVNQVWLEGRLGSESTGTTRQRNRCVSHTSDGSGVVVWDLITHPPVLFLSFH